MSERALRGVAVTIACTDLERSHRFYADVLGAKRDPRDEGHGCRWFVLGDLRLSLMPNATERSPATFPQHAMPMLWLEIDDVDAVAGELERAGVPIIERDEGLFVMVADPDGLLIEIWQAAASR